MFFLHQICYIQCELDHIHCCPQFIQLSKAEKSGIHKLREYSNNTNFLCTSSVLHFGHITNRINQEKNEYYLSSIFVNKSHILNSFAFGEGPFSNGGAIFVSSSKLFVVSSNEIKGKFSKNMAKEGGAIWGNCCMIRIENLFFSENIAYKTSGSILSIGTCDGISCYNDSAYHDSFQVIHCHFEKNQAEENGGAIYVNQLAGAYFTGNIFISNIAGYSGGSIFVINTNTTFKSCIFLENRCGKHFGKRNIKINKCKSGGSISVTSLLGKEYIKLMTEGCCFNNNFMFSNQQYNNIWKCNSIHLNGAIQYESFKDNFNRHNINQIITVNNQAKFKFAEQINSEYQRSKYAGHDLHVDNPQTIEPKSEEIFSPTQLRSPDPTPSRSIGKFSRITRVLTDSPIFIESDIWISHYSIILTKGSWDEDISYI